jgi:hypothetical protein
MSIHNDNFPNYFGDVTQDYVNGVSLDLHVKLAIDFLKATGAVPFDDENGTKELTTAGRAAYALDLAQALLAEASSRGYIKHLPDHDDLSQAQRRHIRRQVRAQVVGQAAAQEIMRDEAPQIGIARANGLI